MPVEEASWSVDGTRVYGQWHAPDKAKSGVVLLHGFSSSLREFGSLPEHLANAGHGVLAIDLRGHGLSAGERGRVDLERACRDLDAAVAEAERRLGRKAPLALVGHSLGAALAIGFQARRGRFDRLVAAHPVDRLIDEPGPLERLGYHVLGRLGALRARSGRSPAMVPRPPKYRDLFEDKAVRAQAKAEGLIAGRLNLGNYAFATTMQASEWARHVRVPVLGITSPHDRAVQPAHSDHVLDSLDGPVQRLEHHGGHSCFMDLDRARVFAGIERFLGAQT